ncbi:MAG: RtcB family protein [Acidobacteriaceae bacterium]|nr:RtcB family protein [Acidobacteriaceae bacterium]MBV9502156.1 RtcB family protein [Acidobacteriaceae bacterium]
MILEGVEDPLGNETLYSTVHGAGRAMGRMEAKGKYSKAGHFRSFPMSDITPPN